MNCFSMDLPETCCNTLSKENDVGKVILIFVLRHKNSVTDSVVLVRCLYF